MRNFLRNLKFIWRHLGVRFHQLGVGQTLIGTATFSEEDGLYCVVIAPNIIDKKCQAELPERMPVPSGSTVLIFPSREAALSVYFALTKEKSVAWKDGRSLFHVKA